MTKNNLISEILEIVFYICVMYIIVSGLWVLGEKLMYGEVTPRGIDDIVALVLAVSLYFNFKK